MHVPQLQGSAPLLLARCLQTRSSCLKHRAPTVPAPVRGTQCLLETIKNTQQLWLLPKAPLYHPLYDPIACAPAGRQCLTLYLYRRAGGFGEHRRGLSEGRSLGSNPSIRNRARSNPEAAPRAQTATSFWEPVQDPQLRPISKYLPTSLFMENKISPRRS